VCIKHASGYESQYGHLSKILVRKGQRVKQRQRIGLVGATGEATGPHLDFRLLVKGKYVDPLRKQYKMVQHDKHVPRDLRKRFAEVIQKRRLSLGNLRAAGRTGSAPTAALQ
jgi:murein DD-endopeptidase MepM/ murein hydrolase activator NlpD